ncbi:hypothetical protein K474DRAFT_1606976, partial [Panus rudis PR-1116 ss-1]
GELEHRRVKRFYARTNKKNAPLQIARLDRRDRAIWQIRHKSPAPLYPLRSSQQGRKRGRKPLSDITAETHHIISHTTKTPIYILPWLRQYRQAEDPALANFIPMLKNHFLARLRHPGQADPGTIYSPSQLDQIVIEGDRIYQHATMRVQYTTYDMQRSHDVLSVKRHANIMTLTPDHDPDTGESADGHPFMYRQILRIFHADVLWNRPRRRPTRHRMEFLWVRNYQLDRSYKAGLKRRRLHRVELVPATASDAFSFVDPDEVIRAVHLIPAFAHGRLEDEDPGASEDNTPWKYFYVNWWVIQCHSI